MRLFLFACLIAASVSCSTVAPQPPDAEIRGLLNDQAAAWSRGDLEAACAVYADDAAFLSPSGLTKGRRGVLDRYREKYMDRAGMGSLRLDVQEIRPLGEASASVVARWELTWPDKPNVSGLTLLVFQKTNAGWRIVQDASM